MKLQYHGGTNFGRSAGGPFITTSYDYDAPLDEYGNLITFDFECLFDLKSQILLKWNITFFLFIPKLFMWIFIGLIREPKYGHLKELHKAIKQCEPALVSGDPTVISLGTHQKVFSFIETRILNFSFQQK